VYVNLLGVFLNPMLTVSVWALRWCRDCSYIAFHLVDTAFRYLLSNHPVVNKIAFKFVLLKAVQTNCYFSLFMSLDKA
jgi:hypothetical protein